MPAIPIPKENTVKAAKFRVKYKDIFDMAQFYKDLHDWLLSHYSYQDCQMKLLINPFFGNILC